MATFIGFSTIDQPKKFTLVDRDLIKRDFLNAFNIQQGQLVGRPEYGTNLWNFIFENQTQETERAIVQEIQRVAGGDPRIFVSDVQLYPQQNGVMVQIELNFVPGTDAEQLALFFNLQSRRASYI